VGARKPKPLDAAGLLSYAVRALSGRALSQGELRARLAARAERLSDVSEVLQKVKAYGYINDQRFAETFARLRLENQGLGRARVLRDLRGRRVAPALAEQVVREAYSEVDEGRLIEQYLRRKLRHTFSPTTLQEPRRLASLYRALLRAGFSPAKVWETLRRLGASPAHLEDLESAADDISEQTSG
jgi:regulatory protein